MRCNLHLSLPYQIQIQYRYLIFKPDTTAQVIWPTLANAGALSASAVYAGCSTGVGSSVQKNKGFSYNFFNITGTGSNTTGTATSIQNQGIRYPAAACDN